MPIKEWSAAKVNSVFFHLRTSEKMLKMERDHRDKREYREYTKVRDSEVYIK